MRNALYKISSVSISLALFFLLYSCVAEKKFAREFIKNDSTRTVLVIPPDYLYKISLKDYELEDADSLDEWELDSILYENSIFLKYIVDSVFLNDYHLNYCMELENLGFIVYNEDSLMSFLAGKTDSYILNLAQMELEEYLVPIVEKAEFEEYLYYQVINLNAVNVNSWIEVSRMNDEEKKELFFSSIFKTDELDGYFRYNYFSGKAKYNYSIDSLFLDEVYQLSELAGYLYAGYTFDYLMNQYIDKRTEEENKRRSRIYYHYDQKYGSLVPAKEDEKFVPMDE